MKEYHLYLYTPDDFNIKDYKLTFADVSEAVRRGHNVKTTQIITCRTELFTMGYRIFIHVKSDDAFEITLGNSERTNREIRLGHSLYNMLMRGVFENCDPTQN